MEYEQAIEIFAKMNEGMRLKQASAEEVQDVFSAFSRWEASLIDKRAQHWIDTHASKHFEKLGSEVFQLCCINDLARHFPSLNTLVEHDIESWIEDASEIIAEGLIRKMESYISPEPAHFRDKLDFFKKIDFDTCVKIVNHDLNVCLRRVEEKLSGSVAVEAAAAILEQANAVIVNNFTAIYPPIIKRGEENELLNITIQYNDDDFNHYEHFIDIESLDHVQFNGETMIFLDSSGHSIQITPLAGLQIADLPETHTAMLSAIADSDAVIVDNDAVVFPNVGMEGEDGKRLPLPYSHQAENLI